MYVTQDIADRIKWRLKEKGIRTKDMLSDLNMGINAISEFAKGKQMSCIALARIALSGLLCGLSAGADRQPGGQPLSCPAG